MKIAFDAKRFFHNTSGLGNYSRDLVRILAEYSPKDEFVLLAEKQSQRGKDILSLPNVSYASVSKGMLARQLKMGVDAQNLGANIFHGLSGELPLKWNEKPIKKIVTIHDLIFVRYPELYSFFDRKIHFWKFKKAAEIQTGIKAYYFSKFASQRYFPILNEFILPSTDSHSIGGRPIVDVYFNMKVKRMMIYAEAQHLNTTFMKNQSYAAPFYPVADFRLNLGLVWYLFH